MLKEKAEKTAKKRKGGKNSIFLGLVMNTTVVYDVHIFESVKTVRWTAFYEMDTLQKTFL